MQLTIKTKEYAVVDGFVPDDLWRLIWEGLGHEQMAVAPVIGQYTKEWGFDGSMGWSSPPNYLSDYNKGKLNYASALGTQFMELAKQLPDLVGDGWNDIRVHAHVFGRGTRLYWHYDKHSLGSFAWYAHPEWRHNWGGEILVASEVPKHDDLLNPPPRHLDRQFENDLLVNGIGTYLAPLPNRCILTAPGLFHSVNRVDPDAGDALRVSVVGFLVKNKKEN